MSTTREARKTPAPQEMSLQSCLQELQAWGLQDQKAPRSVALRQGPQPHLRAAPFATFPAGHANLGFSTCPFAVALQAPLEVQPFLGPDASAYMSTGAAQELRP